jgi:hypothetical protein
MSIEVLLIPLGIAAVGAISSMIKEGRSTDLCEKCKATRIVDPDILIEALQTMGVTVLSNTGTRILADGPWGKLTFQKVGDIFLGRVDAGNEAATHTMLAALDTQVGRVVQGRTAALVMERAKELGFRLIEQREEDGALNYVFEEIK